jgi:hypothetical protein
VSKSHSVSRAYLLLAWRFDQSRPVRHLLLFGSGSEQLGPLLVHASTAVVLLVVVCSRVAGQLTSFCHARRSPCPHDDDMHRENATPCRMLTRSKTLDHQNTINEKMWPALVLRWLALVSSLGIRSVASAFRRAINLSSSPPCGREQAQAQNSSRALELPQTNKIL